MAKIIAICNQKGGVGKTATSINLASGLAHFNKKVLLLDMDPQGNSSRGLSVDISLITRSIYDVLVKDLDINKMVRKTMVKDLDLISPKAILSSLESSVSEEKRNYDLLKNSLAKLEKNYDYVIIDCPPSLGFITYNCLNASDSVLIPVQCEYFATEAITSILSTISNIQSNFQPNLKLEGFVLTMYEKSRFADDLVNEIRTLFRDHTFNTLIPRSISISESNKNGVPITTFRPTSAISRAYFALAKEVIDKDKLQ